MHTLIHTPKGNLERPIDLAGMSLDCGRKPEYLVRTHTCTGRTLDAERPLDGNRTQDLLTARQQCYQLRHHAAPSYKTIPQKLLVVPRELKPSVYVPWIILKSAFSSSSFVSKHVTATYAVW
ncbi:hypothetical protein AMECASPLE_033770 [Ameca splendens]|uniref:Uncharacterized protein n=1 Tax=Ameca splendens TaxID=208324 RepID=A0ABV0ZGM5_9TELE